MNNTDYNMSVSSRSQTVLLTDLLVLKFAHCFSRRKVVEVSSFVLCFYFVVVANAYIIKYVGFWCYAKRDALCIGVFLLLLCSLVYY